MARVIYDKQVIGSCMFQELGHLNTELDAWIGHSRDKPSLCAIVISRLKNTAKSNQVLFDTVIVLPPQQEDRNFLIRGRWALGLSLDEHGGILEMAGVRLEVMAFGWRFLWLKDVMVLQAIVTWSAAESQLFRRETDGHVGV